MNEVEAMMKFLATVYEECDKLVADQLEKMFAGQLDADFASHFPRTVKVVDEEVGDWMTKRLK